MNASPGILKRSFDMVAVLALLNLVGVGALAAYCVATGVVTTRTLRDIGQVLRGGGSEHSDIPGADNEEPKSSDGVARQPNQDADSLDNADAMSQVQMEIVQREAERIRVELDQRLSLINSVLLRVENERKSFLAERERARQADKEEREARKDVGFEKQVAIFESLSPKVAVQHLLSMNDSDEAAKILMSLDTDQAKKIVEAARRGEELMRMQAILQSLRNAAPAKSMELEGEQP